MIEELTHVLKIINTCDWEDDTSTPAEFQEHADAFGKHLLAVWGDAAVTPYVHDIIAGHIRDQMMLWGPICRLSNEAAERKGGQGLVKRFLGHSQRGGCTGAKGSLLGNRWRRVGRLAPEDLIFEPLQRLLDRLFEPLQRLLDRLRPGLHAE